MSIRIIETNEYFDCDFTIVQWKSLVRLSGKNLPKIPPHNFEVIENDMIIDYFYNFDIIYDVGEDYIEFTDDTNIYYNHLLVDENNYVTEIVTLPTKMNTFVFQSGQGKKYAEFNMNLYDNNSIPLYKIENGELIELSEEVRTELNDSRLKAEFENAMLNKISELSNVCQTIIYSGTDVTLSNGTKHYSFTLADQNNIGSLFTSAVLTKTDGIPYHADNDECELFTYLDIVRLNKAMQEFILYNTTYFNMLKSMVSELTTIDEINAITYGTSLSDEYMSKMTDILTQSQTMFINTLTVYGISLEELSNL